MPGQIDKVIKAATKQALAELGTALNSTITFTKKTSGTYNISTGDYFTSDTSFPNLKVPVEFIRSEEETAQEMRQAKIYLTPDLIGDNQPDLEDEVTLSFAGSNRLAQIVDIDTKKGGQTYLFTLLVRF